MGGTKGHVLGAHSAARRRERVLARLAVVLATAEGRWLDFGQLARQAGVERGTAKRYRDQVLVELARRRQTPVGAEDMVVIERMLADRARDGDMDAVRLLFMRLKGRAVEEALTPPSIAELEEALEMLRAEERWAVEAENKK